MPPPPQTQRTEASHIWAIAGPVIVGQLGHAGMGVADTVMVGRLGEDALAAVGVGGVWAMLLLIVARGVMHGLDPVVSQAWGRGDEVALGRALRQGLALALVLSVPTAAMHFAAEHALRLMAQPEATIPTAAAYCRALAFGVPGTLVFLAVRLYLQGVGIVRPTTAVVLGCNGLNIVLNGAFIFGWFGAPALGPVGSGVATAISQWAMAGALLWLTREELSRVWLGWSGLRWSAVLELFLIGLPAGANFLLEAGAFLFSGVMMGWIDTTSVAAHSVTMNLIIVSFMLPLGVSAGAAARVGHLVGAGQPWRTAARASLLLGGGVMCVSAVLFSTVPGPLARLYTDDPAVVALAATLIPVGGLFQVFDGLQVVASGALRGAGILRAPAVAVILSYWLIGVPTSLWLAFERGWGAQGVWTGLLVGLVLLGTGLVLWVERVAISAPPEPRP